jgi:uncharacterized protein
MPLVNEWVQRQLLERGQVVDQPGVMFQRWTDLLFLHWMVDPETIQQTLPAGLSVDTYEGTAWIGIVPFCMRRVQLIPAPFFWCNFLELNLRTYVRDSNGRPGIWFYSLDANYPVAVWMAALFFSLPYMHARMQVTYRNEEIRYSCQRRGSSAVLVYEFRPFNNIGDAKIGSLEFFLIERYRLFCFRRGRLLTGRVYHSPYLLREAIITNFDKRLFSLNRLHAPAGLPNSMLYSPGVDVTVYPIKSAH